ncbi:plasmid replication protein, CyRepA1 family [Pleurocapsa sp. PCC 7319]|uniref:plasmid replication protein, CyRepA1 family n=1 Tax=Pleurocapsa sp. PCC 7319 TaxID=118161 RepID=UPI00034969D6|nr:plasmid replication protein, CyRepA1 family [Pleurocapsa sp. PCC 7319]
MDYLLEWKASGVDEKLTHLNVVSLQGTSPAEYLLYSNSIPRRNDGRISERFLQRYAHTDAGGWWCSGIDVLSGEEDIWGCFKPEYPRSQDNCHKLIKYEHPPKTSTGLFALKVPRHLWQKIADRAGVSLTEADIKPHRADLGFWEWMSNHAEVPLCITEGAKKAGALLSAGYGAVALPGINNGYRTPKDDNGKRIGKSHLIPQLAKLASPKRDIYIVFDQDSKPKTIKAVNAAIKKTGYLLQKAGCQVRVVTWNSRLGKGVDDLIANQGQESFFQAYERALGLETWKAKSWTNLTYPTQIEVNSRYLPELDIPPATKLIGIKSPKGSGKTESLSKIVAQAIARRQKVLVIGHRVQLVKELCQRFGLNYVTELNQQPHTANLGYGLCIDSLHSSSQAKFNPAEWSNSLVIIDEVEQVLWHSLNSSTCKERRVEILKSFKNLMQNVIGQQGQVFVADADLSDIALDYLISLSGINLEPYIIKNVWQSDRQLCWQVYNYSGKTPKKLVKNLETHIQQGGKPFVCLSAQKLTSKWSTQTLETYLQQKFPQKRILRIDSESLTDPHHPAYRCITNLEQILLQYDLVLASPSIETGISIELKDHFTSVWAIAQGIQGENAVRQTLARLRDNVPRHLWCANYSFNKIGNGSTSIPALLSSNQRFTQLNIRLLQQSDFAYLDDLDTGFQAESLLCWAKMAVRFNAGAIDYRQSILAGLKAEGHQILDAAKVKFKQPEIQPGLRTELKTDSCLLAVISEISSQNYLAECKAIANSESLDQKQYQNLKKRLIKSLSDRRKLRRYELQQRYHLPITPELVALDDDGWYQKIRLHYFLTIGRPYLADRDAKVARKLIEQGDGSLFLPDFNSSQLGALVGTLEIMGIPILLQNTARHLRNTDLDLQSLAAIAHNNRREIKTILGIGIAKNFSPITIVSRLLDKIGCKIKCIRYESQNKKRVRVYKILPPEDLREQVFAHWLNIDRQLPGNSLFWSENKALNSHQPVTNNTQSQYLQLRLEI